MMVWPSVAFLNAAALTNHGDAFQNHSRKSKHSLQFTIRRAARSSQHEQKCLNFFRSSTLSTHILQSDLSTARLHIFKSESETKWLIKARNTIWDVLPLMPCFILVTNPSILYETHGTDRPAISGHEPQACHHLSPTPGINCLLFCQKT